MDECALYGWSGSKGKAASDPQRTKWRGCGFEQFEHGDDRPSLLSHDERAKLASYSTRNRAQAARTGYLGQIFALVICPVPKVQLPSVAQYEYYR